MTNMNFTIAIGVAIIPSLAQRNAQDLVHESCGALVKGTPDGGFVDTDGLLRHAGALDGLRGSSKWRGAFMTSGLLKC